MSENLDRVQLNELEEEQVVGGTLIYRNEPDQKCYNVYSSDNPDVRYGINYDNVIDVKFYERRDLAGKSDDEKLAILLEEGKIFVL